MNAMDKVLELVRRETRSMSKSQYIEFLEDLIGEFVIQKDAARAGERNEEDD